MKIIFGILLGLAILYCCCGVIMAIYEQSQTDDPFKPLTIITWLPKMFGFFK